MRLDAIAPAWHFSVGAGYVVARSYDTALPSGVRASVTTGAPPLVLTRAQLQVEGLTLAWLIQLPGLRSVAALDRADAHLARVFAEQPAAFHDRHRLARWGVVLRCGIPSLTALAMVVGALLLPRLTDAANSGLWMALHDVPIGLLVLSFSLQELAQFEIPPWPRRARAERCAVDSGGA